MELVIRNAQIIDGTGKPAFKGDIGVSGGTIAAVGGVVGRGAQEIDAVGMAASPGFIDVHTHYDAQVGWDPMLTPSIYHGVTSVIAGNCGFTLAPLSGKPEDTDYLLRMLSRVEGMPLATLRAAVKPAWKSFGEFLTALDGRLALNTAFLVGHSALRRAVMGERAVGEEATPTDLDAMAALLDRSLAEGGMGLSTTMSATHSDYEGRPVPSRWSTREERLRLAAVVREHPGTWLEMVTGRTEMNDSDYATMTELAVAADRPLNWNLVVVASASRAAYQSQLAASDYARARNATVFGLVPAVPPKVIVNFISGFVLDTIPNWPEMLLLPHAQKRVALADPAVRQRLREGLERIDMPAIRHMFADWGLITLESIGSARHQCWLGRTLGEYGTSLGVEPLEALFDLAVAEDLQLSFAPPPIGADAEPWRMRGEAWRDPRLLLGGSDAGAHLDMINTFALSTQLLGEGVRERGLIGLEDAVHRITGLPAARFGLLDRGLLQVGMAADIVVFDPTTVSCGPVEMRTDLPGNESRLTADARGIEHLFVNGVDVIRGGALTGKLGGKVLRSGRDTRTVLAEPSVAPRLN